jgi:1-acyl-sn-glycerol-3-phosphate acyltransferase
MATPKLPKVAKRERTLILRIAAALLIPLVRLTFRIDAKGLELLPKSGPYILISNHVSYVDPLSMAYLVYVKLKRAPHFLAKEGLFKFAPIGRLLASLGQIPVYRSGRSNEEPLRAAHAFLKAGQVIIIFPEGTLTRDPDLWPMRGRSGAIRLAIESNVPVFPVAQWGVDHVLGNYSNRFRPNPFFPVQMTVGPEIDLSELRGRSFSTEELTKVTSRVMHTLADMVAELRGEPAPKELWESAKHGQAQTGNFRKTS